MRKVLDTPDGSRWVVAVRWRGQTPLTRRLIDRLPGLALVAIPFAAVFDVVAFLAGALGHALGMPWRVEAASGSRRHEVRVRGRAESRKVAADMVEALSRGERLGYPQVL